MKVVVVDTHALVWWLEASRKVSPSLRQLLNHRDTRLHLAALVIAELVDMCAKGKTPLQLEPLLAGLRSDERVVMHDLTAEMALQTANYASLPDIHDRCIVATTAMLIQTGHDAVLVTRDRAIRDSGLVPTFWE